MVSLADVTEFWNGLPAWTQLLVRLGVVVVIGVLAQWIVRSVLDRSMQRNRHMDDTARLFLVRTAGIVVWIFVAVVILGLLGVDAAALAGGLAVGGFIVGFALKDSLGNLAAGVMLLFYRPFSVGETVTIDGESGDVVALGMALTTIKAADGRIVTLPNGAILGGTIVNHTREPKRRADVLVGIGYDDDIDHAVRAIMEAVKADPRVLDDPAPGVRITDLGDNAVGLQVRPWVRTDDFWQAKADLTGTVKRALDAAGCSIPYPQRDLHIVSGGLPQDASHHHNG